MSKSILIFFFSSGGETVCLLLKLWMRSRSPSALHLIGGGTFCTRNYFTVGTFGGTVTCFKCSPSRNHKASVGHSPPPPNDVFFFIQFGLSSACKQNLRSLFWGENFFQRDFQKSPLPCLRVTRKPPLFVRLYVPKQQLTEPKRC